MRDNLRNYEYFHQNILDIQDSINRKMKWIKNGKTKEDRINDSKRAIVGDYIHLIMSKYSIGFDKSQFAFDLEMAIAICNESWDGFWKAEESDTIYDQYILSAYDEMLWMLSLGYLLNVSDDIFIKLVDVIDRDNVKDLLFEFIISAKIKGREPLIEESYRNYFGVPEVFAKLREAISIKNKSIAERLVEEFITKKWYKNHKESGWYNCHKSKYNLYYGYWSFETAVIVKIMGLDDTNFKYCKYYPKDLL